METENKVTDLKELVGNKNMGIGVVDIRSGLFKVLTIVISVVGFIAGIVLGVIAPMTVLDQEYTILERTKEAFNWPLMIGVWLAFAVIAVSFWAVYCHLNNQEETLQELKRLTFYTKNKE